jgi:undecaprenyl-diphosphatase
MNFEQILGLGILQGLTEFLPISSSAHLILMPLILGWQDQGLAFDVAVHVGSLTSVVSYFRKDLRLLIVAWLGSIVKGERSQQSKLAWLIIIGTIPVGIIGLLSSDIVETELRSPVVIAMATIMFGVLLWWADVKGSRIRDDSSLTIKDALVVGLFQVLALIPGTSRSGITMTAGLFLGLSRKTASRFSFLLSIPLIFLAGSLKTIELARSSIVIDWLSLISGAAVSALSAFICISLFLKVIEKMGMLPFVIYRLVLGFALLYFYAI